MLAPEQVNEQVIQQAAWVHTTGMCLIEEPVRAAVLRGMALARAARVPVSLDLNLRLGIVGGALPQEYAATLWAAIACADYIFGSARDEIALLVPERPMEEALRLLAADGRTAIARLGAGGATIVTVAGSATVPAFHVPIVDTLGAGDAFNAGFIAARLDGKSNWEAVRWGNAVAALKIGRQGGRGAPFRAEVEAFLQDEGAQS